ncbi:Uma2 family endonuclease [Pseudanabaena minima]|uniref:Uma2 family endonuclease n=1 Tax=Pseudanabaena minima TaxID=890415 RepID=UPI003DA95A54
MTITVSAKANDPKNSVEVKPEIESDVWLKASWDKFLALTEEPSLDKARFYYDQNLMRIEMSPVGPIHAHENGVVYKVISIFASFADICIYEYLNCSFRKNGDAEFQPDMVFYLGNGLKIPPRNNAIVDVNEFDLPTLVVEISATTIQDDLGYKRLLYERLGIQEYWAVNASTSEVFAFAIAEGRSGRITESQVLKGLDISKVEEALQLSYVQDDGAITKWIFQTFAKS